MKTTNKKQLYEKLKKLSDNYIEKGLLIRNLIGSLKQEDKPFKEQYEFTKQFLEDKT